jgi:flagellar motor switch protein FliN/FliY
MAPEDTAKTPDAAAPAAPPKEEQTPAAATATYERPKASVRPHDLSPLKEAPAGGEGGNIDLLMDVSVPIVAQLGSTEMRIREILRLTPGAVVELNKLAGEPVDLLVRGQLFAQGEVVVVDESFGIRVTKIVSPGERSESTAGA